MSANGVLNAARALGHTTGDGSSERVCGGFYLRLTRTDGQRRLIVARRDRVPTFEEVEAIAQAAGAPVGCEPLTTTCTIASQDGIITRLPALIVGWRLQ